MKRLAIALVVLLVCAGCSGPSVLDAARKFQSAEEAFRVAQTPEDFLAVAARYQEILDAGIVSGAVLYNQGNAYMQAGKRAQAIAAYRRARRYRPRDPFLEANLKFALGDAGAVELRRPVIETMLFWQDWLSQAEKLRLAFAAASLAFVLGLTALFVSARRVPRVAALGAVVLTLLLSGSAFYDSLREGEMHGVLSVVEATARKGNAETYEPAFNEPLREGAEFVIVEERAGWILIRLPDGLEGWIEKAAAVSY